MAASGEPEQSTQNRIWAVSWIAAARAVDGGGHSHRRGHDRRDSDYRTAAFASGGAR